MVKSFYYNFYTPINQLVTNIIYYLVKLNHFQLLLNV